MGRRRRGHHGPQRAEKVEQKRRDEFDRSQRRLERRRNVLGALVIVPLTAVFFNVPYGPLEMFGIAPLDGWLLVLAILFGSFLGLTIRMVLERRQFSRLR